MRPVTIQSPEVSGDPFKKFMRDNLNARLFEALCNVYYDGLPESSKEALQRDLPALIQLSSSKQRAIRGFYIAMAAAASIGLVGAAIVSVNAGLTNGDLFNDAGTSGIALCFLGLLALSAVLLSHSRYDKKTANDMCILLRNKILYQSYNPQEEPPVPELSGQQTPDVSCNVMSIFATSLAVHYGSPQVESPAPAYSETAEQHGSPCALAIVDENAAPQATVNDVDAESVMMQSVAPSTIDRRF